MMGEQCGSCQGATHQEEQEILCVEDLGKQPAGSTDTPLKQMMLNLAEYRSNASPTRSKMVSMFNWEEKKRSPEEMFLLNNISMPVHSNHLVNDIYMKIMVDHEGCICCDDYPAVMVPVSIIPMGSPESYGMVEPPGYMPMELGKIKFEI